MSRIDRQNKAVPGDWHEWARVNGYVHYGYKAGKPLLMKMPNWARQFTCENVRYAIMRHAWLPCAL